MLLVDFYGLFTHECTPQNLIAVFRENLNSPIVPAGFLIHCQDKMVASVLAPEIKQIS